MTSRVQLVRQAVPVGEENARPVRDIWLAIGSIAEGSIAVQLLELANAGCIKRKHEPPPDGGGLRWLYWREAA